MKLLWILSIFSLLCSAQINPQRITESSKEYIIHTRRGDNLIYMSLLTRKVDQIRFNDRDCWRIVQIYEKTDNVDYDTSYVDINTLKPVAYRAFISGHQREIFDFSNGRMTGRVIWPDSIDKSFDEPLADDVYNSVMSLEIIQSLNFSKNKTYSFKMFNPGKGGIFSFQYTLNEEKLIDFAGVKIECLIIDSKTFFGDKERTGGTHYIEKKTGRLLKHVYPFPNNSGEYIKSRIL